MVAIVILLDERLNEVPISIWSFTSLRQ